MILDHDNGGSFGSALSIYNRIRTHHIACTDAQLFKIDSHLLTFCSILCIVKVIPVFYSFYRLPMTVTITQPHFGLSFRSSQPHYYYACVVWLI